MGVNAQFDTARLKVNAWADDLNGAARQKLIDELGDILTPAVLQHLPEPLQISNTPAAIDAWIDDRVAESDVLAVREISSSELAGLIILATFEEPEQVPVVHLGYFLGETYWGKGLATELLRGLVGWYADQGEPAQLLGGVERDNIASAKVLQKAGFERVEDLSTHAIDMFRCVV